jgi:hypothetical protein
MARPLQEQELLQLLMGNSSSMVPRAPMAMADEVPVPVPPPQPESAPVEPPPAPEEMPAPRLQAPQKTSAFVEPPEAKQLRALLSQQLDNQAAGVELSKARYMADAQARAANPATDLSPTLNWIDNFQGSNLAKGYKAPAMGDGRAELQDYLKAQNELPDNQIKYLKALLEGKKDAKDSARNEASRRSYEYRMFKDVKGQNEKLTKRYSDFTQQAGNVKAAFTPDSDGMVPIGRINSALSNFARMMGEKGVLTDQDTARQIQKNVETKLAEITSRFGSDPSVKVPATAISTAIDAYNDAVKNFQEAHMLESQELSDVFHMPGSPFEGADFGQGFQQQADKRLSGLSKYQIKPPRSENAMAGGKNSADKRSYDDMSLEEIEAEAARRGVK